VSHGEVCLGVTHSAAGRHWRFRLDDDARATRIAQRLGIPESLARILAGRGVPEADLDRHFDASLKAWMPDPSLLLGLDRAAARLADALASNEPCAVFGDYDVDGGASAALLVRYFRALGRKLRVYIPDRMTEGYGPNAAAMRTLADEGIRLVVTVDCGAQAFEALEAARDAGLQVIVSDHHLMSGGSPVAHAIVNPNQPGDTSGLGHVCAAGVTFMLLAGLNRELRRRDWFATSGTPEPDLRRCLDLVALATVCDVVPLVGLNRAFVKNGLRMLESGGNAGLAALMQVAGLKSALRSSHFGFALGPRVNAGGRVGRADLGALMLASDDLLYAGEAAAELDRYNRERQAIESFVLQEALAQVERDGVRPGLVAAFGEGWHAGVVGIVAGRLKDRYDLPSAVFAIEDGIARASLRSVSGVNLGAAVGEAKAAGLLISGGGHAMAAGLSVARERVGEVIAFLDSRLAEAVQARSDRGLYKIDAIVGPATLTPQFYDLIERAGPFGAGNPEPVVVIPDARIVESRIVGENHVSVVAMCGGDRLKGIAFRAAETPLGALLLQKGRPIHLAGRLLANDWQGQRRIELSIEDAATP
jgi:single-stranded-DNA-specific exonuclease